MDFTREPIIETIITPREGYKLVIRSSKSAGQEEYFVDAVEIIAFGHALFFRSLERPKAFLVPVSDYEVLEVREARMVLKNVGLDRSIKIGGGRESNLKAARETEKAEVLPREEEVEQEEAQPVAEPPTEVRSEVRVDKKRDRRRHYRKRRGREEGVKEEAVESPIPSLEDEKINIPPPEEGLELPAEGVSVVAPSLFSSLLQPPPTLISETINRYRQNDLFKGAFYLTEEEQYKPHDKVHELLSEDDEEDVAPTLLEPSFDSEESSEAILSESQASEVLLEESKVVEEVEKQDIELQEQAEEESGEIEEQPDERSTFNFEEKAKEISPMFSTHEQEKEGRVLTEETSYTPEQEPEQEEDESMKNNDHHPFSHEES